MLLDNYCPLLYPLIHNSLFLGHSHIYSASIFGNACFVPSIALGASDIAKKNQMQHSSEYRIKNVLIKIDIETGVGLFFYVESKNTNSFITSNLALKQITPTS